MKITIEPAPQSGAHNMQVDAQMLADALDHGTPSLRLYSWESATVSLGYFQKQADVPARFAGLPCVKRLSGGGAILHEHELTYSFALPPGHGFSQPTDLYELAHAAVIQELATVNIAACLRRDFGGRAGSPEEPFLCFERHNEFDVVLCDADQPGFAGCKVLGSAQRRRKGAVLQHGSLVLRRSVHTPDFPGVFEVNEFELVRFADCLARRISADFATRNPPAKEFAN